MIQPIQLTLIGPSNGLGSIAPYSGISGAAGSNGPGSAANSTLLGRSLQISNVNLAVTQMLQDVGGGVENDKMLQLMIALLILMALLENMQQQQGGSGGSSGGSGSSFNTAQLMGMFLSSSSITIEQTTLTMSSVNITGTYGVTGNQLHTTGQQIDIAA